MILTPHPTWEVRDSSKISDYYECPRKFFFMHLLGWRIDAHQHDLFFGQAWHIAREYMLINGYDDMQGAYNAFIQFYRQGDKTHMGLSPDTDELYRPKVPDAVLMAIAKFAGHPERRYDLEENEVLYTEISGSVPVDEKRIVYFRMDSVLRNKEKGFIFSWDHKTTKKFSRVWEEQFYLSIPNGTYTHCLYCLFPEEMRAGLIKGVEFCGTQFEYLKKGSKARPQGYHIDVKRVPAWREPKHMNTWLWNMVDLLDDLDRDMDRVMDCKESDSTMMAFRQNPGSCTNYWGCMFHDYCMSWTNPLQQCFEPPLGFKEEFWDPREMETTNKMNLEWK